MAAFEPQSPAPPDNDGRVVRFDNECVLIPEYSSQRGPRVVTKSYSLPLWKRRGAPASETDAIHDLSSNSLCEETHVVIRVPIPRLVRRTSPSRSASGRSLSLSPTIPLSPCLVQRTPSSLAPEPRLLPSLQSLNRRLPQPIYQRRQDDQTVPLRACCPNCFPITEQCLREGSSWKENFTKGARRRRSASLDSAAAIGSALMDGNTSGSCRVRVLPSTLAFAVDEVDKHRRSLELASVVDSNSQGIRSQSSSGYGNKYDQDQSAAPLLSDLSPPDFQPYSIPLRNASPIAEEDESQLFPLPSPCRSPTGSARSSPTQSPWNSPRTSPGVSPKISPGPSPNASSLCLYPSSADVLVAALADKTKTTSTEDVHSEELMLSSEISQRSGDVLGIPNSERKLHSLAATFSTLAVNSETVSSSDSNNDVDAKSNSATFSSTPFNLSSSTMSGASSASESSITPSTSKVISSPKTGRKLSFGFPFLKAGEAIKDASADVLRGVSSISREGGLRM